MIPAVVSTVMTAQMTRPTVTARLPERQEAGMARPEIGLQEASRA